MRFHHTNVIMCGQRAASLLSPPNVEDGREGEANVSEGDGEQCCFWSVQ